LSHLQAHVFTIQQFQELWNTLYNQYLPADYYDNFTLIVIIFNSPSNLKFITTNHTNSYLRYGHERKKEEFTTNNHE
jgi:hypothetical protein